MTAPLDIGLEQLDPTLRYGQDDVFDLEDTQKGLRKKGGIAQLGDDMDLEASSDEEAADEDDENEEVLEEEEERERKVVELEQELDGLYDTYQERMRERDAKYMVKEARMKDKAREEWGGINKPDSEDEEGSDNEDGGWDNLQAWKARADEDSDSSDSDDETEVQVPQQSKKRRREEGAVKTRKSAKKARIETNGAADGATPLSRTAQVWFSQDFFKSAGLEDVEGEDEGMEAEGDVDESDAEMDVEDDGDGGTLPEAVCGCFFTLLSCIFNYFHSPCQMSVTTTLRSCRKVMTMRTETCGTWRTRTRMR